MTRLRRLLCIMLALALIVCALSAATASAATEGASPVITKQPEDCRVAEYGDRATVSVEAQGEGLTYQWYIAGIYSSKYTKSSNTTPVYSITLNEDAVERQLYCVITDKNGNSVKTDTVIIVKNVNLSL